MSRVGLKPISLPEKVAVKLDGRNISVKGPIGRLIASSAYGKALFGFTEAAIEAQGFSAKVDEAQAAAR